MFCSIFGCACLFSSIWLRSPERQYLNSKSPEKWLQYYGLHVHTYPRILDRFSIFHIAARWGTILLVNYAPAKGHLMGHQENGLTSKLSEINAIEFLKAEFLKAEFH
jgi:hypothetical protein